MIRKILLVLFVVLLYTYAVYYLSRSRFDAIYNYHFEYNPNVPKLIHLMYFPWDKNQVLKDNPEDFDHSFYEAMKSKYPDYRVQLWTLPIAKAFVRQEYPQYFNVIFTLPRPVMMVDFLRLLVVYHFGGIYWQYESESKVSGCGSGMDYFLPRVNANVKLFTERVIDDTFARKMAMEPIRQGEPEELVRVCTQVFSAIPKHPYMFRLFQRAVCNMKKCKRLVRDYDVLYIGGNAMMSTVYNQIGKYQPDIELVDWETQKKMVKFSSKGSWRTE